METRAFYNMGNLTKNISRHEITCRCGKCDVRILDDEPIIQIVQETCDHFAKVYGVKRVVLKIGRGASCYVYNRSKAVGSNDNSQHPRCCAIDFSISLPDGKLINPKRVYDYLNYKYPDSMGLGSYRNFTHADTRPNKARW